MNLPTYTHSDLVALAKKWLQRRGCKVVVSEIRTNGPEIPDALGWTADGTSIAIECKASRADYFKDAKKQPMSRRVGEYKYYLVPMGLIKKDEIYKACGLLECFNGRIHKPVDAVRRKGNLSTELLIAVNILRRVEWVYNGGIEKMLKDYTDGIKRELHG